MDMTAWRVGVRREYWPRAGVANRNSGYAVCFFGVACVRVLVERGG